MTFFDSIMVAPAYRVLCWTLVHFLWQGAAIALLLLIARMAIHRSTPRAKYGMSCAAMLLCAAAPVVTFMVLQGGQNHRQAVAPQQSSVVVGDAPLYSATMDVPTLRSAAPESNDVAPASLSMGERINTAAPTVVGVWICGASLLALWRFIGWVWALKLRRQGSLVLDASWRARLSRLQGILGINQPVRLLGTQQLDYPAVIGCIRPAILLPVACLTNLSPAQIEAILAHELAHIRRHDYLVNLIQTIIETALFFHPAVWWISARITDDREDCCDDVAAEVCGDRLSYANSLAALETLRSPSSPVLAATGGVLIRRIRRIVGATDPTSRGTWWPVGGVAMAMLVLLTIQSRTAEVDAQTTQPTANSRSVDIRVLDEAGNPVAGAEVFLVASLDQQRVGRKGTSDRNGLLTIDGLPGTPAKPGYSSAYARVPGKLAGVGQKLPDHPNFPAGPDLVVSLRPVTPHRGTLTLPDGIDPTTLRVTLDSIMGRSPPDIPIARHFSPGADTDRSFWPELFERAIKADGTFEFYDVPDNATVSAKISGPKIASRIVQWNKNQHPKDISVTVDPESILEGRVVYDPPGAALAGLKLSAISHDAIFSGVSKVFSHETEAREDGTFRFPGLAPGTYDVSISEIPSGWISGGLRARVLRGDTVRDAIVRLERGIVVSGTVVDDQTSLPVKGAEVMARVVTPSRSQTSVWSDEQGRFYMRVPAMAVNVFVNMPPEGYTRSLTIPLDLSNPVIAANPPALDVRLVRNPGGQAARPAGGSTTRPGPVAATDLATIRGRVIDKAGQPIGNILVWHQSTVPTPDGRPPSRSGVRTGTDGRFETRTLIDPAALDERVVSIEKWNTTAAMSKPFTPKGGETVDVGDLVVELRPVISQVSGILQDEKRRPVANARVSVTIGVQQATGTDGRFRFELYDRDQPVSLMVQAPAFAPLPYDGIPAGADNVILTLLPHTLAGPRAAPSPQRLIGEPAPAVNVFQWLLNSATADATLPLVRTDGRKTVLLFPECCVAPSVYLEQVQAFNRICIAHNLAGAVIFEPLFQEHTLKSLFDGKLLTIPIGIDQPTDQGYTLLYGLTKSHYGTVNPGEHTIMIIDPAGKVTHHMTKLEDLELVLGRP